MSDEEVELLVKSGLAPDSTLRIRFMPGFSDRASAFSDLEFDSHQISFFYIGIV